MRWLGICQGQRDASNSPRQRLIKTNTSILQSAVKKAKLLDLLSKEDLTNVQEKAQGLTNSSRAYIELLELTIGPVSS